MFGVLISGRDGLVAKLVGPLFHLAQTGPVGINEGDG
jgi:hypothetical protein